MARTHGNGSLPKKKINKANDYPKVYLDTESDFAAIKIRPGVEAKSYLKDGALICEDAKGNIIEVQILNVSRIKHKATA